MGRYEEEAENYSKSGYDKVSGQNSRNFFWSEKILEINNYLKQLYEICNLVPETSLAAQRNHHQGREKSGHDEQMSYILQWQRKICTSFLSHFPPFPHLFFIIPL